MLPLLAGAVISLLGSANAIAFPTADNATCTVTNYTQSLNSVHENTHGRPNPGIATSVTSWNYTIVIGVPHNNSACNAFSSDVGEAGFPPLGLQCSPYDETTVYMNFFSTNTDESANQAVVLALSKAYPSVPFLEDRICLADGCAAPASWPIPTPSSG